MCGRRWQCPLNQSQELARRFGTRVPTCAEGPKRELAGPFRTTETPADSMDMSRDSRPDWYVPRLCQEVRADHRGSAMGGTSCLSYPPFINSAESSSEPRGVGMAYTRKGSGIRLWRRITRSRCDSSKMSKVICTGGNSETKLKLSVVCLTHENDRKIRDALKCKLCWVC